MFSSVIDRIREQIQERLDQLASEADRLRKALAALDPPLQGGICAQASRAQSPARTRAEAAPPKPKAPATKSAPARRTRQAAAHSPRRTAPGATKASVLAALAGGEAMTAGQVAKKTGLARPTVSTTLSKLAKSSEVRRPSAATGCRRSPTTSPSSPNA